MTTPTEPLAHVMTASPNGADLIIEATHVTKTYRTDDVVVHAHRAVSVSVHRDEMVASMGTPGGGKRQRVTIARALVNEPAIVWGDEPTGDLDTQNAEEIMDLITDLNRRHHQTFVIVTHAPDVAQRCHRILYMKDGQIIREEAAAGAPK